MKLKQYLKYKKLKDSIESIKEKQDKIDFDNPYFYFHITFLDFAIESLKYYEKQCYKKKKK